MMIDCPHRAVTEHQLVSCALTPGIHFPPLESPMSPCRQCDGNTPPKTMLPPTPAKAQNQHPDRCVHNEKTINHQGCCEARTWLCAKHGVVDWLACRDCSDFKEDSPSVE